MERDIQFARWVVAEAETLSCKVFVVDGQQTIEDNALKIAAHFGFEAVS